jgi:hypothetical protein
MRRARVLVLVALAACANDPTDLAPPPPAVPAITDASVASNANNTLSASVAVSARDVDSVAVLFRRADEPAVEGRTPAVPVADHEAIVPVLGLRPATDYVFTVVAFGSGAIVFGNELPFTTGVLPADLPSFVAGGTDPLPGFVAVASGTGKYAVVIDDTGRVVWYRYFPQGAGLNFMAQPTGHYVLRPPTPAVGDIEPWVELDVLGNVVRMLTCAGGLQPRPHDLILQPDGSFWIMCDDTRIMDLTALGGVADARVMGTVVQHIGPTGGRLFQWNPFDHFEITDLDLSDRIGANVNWTHGNALDVDSDTTVVVSFRSLNEITRIDTRTGAVLWRLGGLRNQFSFIDTTLPAFAHQHGMRMHPGGVITLLDNIGNPLESRAERYVLDETTRTARLVQSYGSIPGVKTEIGGSVQLLGGGRSLVSFGTAGRVEEYGAADQLLWHIEGNAGYVFRAQRIHSLYQPGVGDPR